MIALWKKHSAVFHLTFPKSISKKLKIHCWKIINILVNYCNKKFFFASIQRFYFIVFSLYCKKWQNSQKIYNFIKILFTSLVITDYSFECWLLNISNIFSGLYSFSSYQIVIKMPSQIFHFIDFSFTNYSFMNFFNNRIFFTILIFFAVQQSHNERNKIIKENIIYYHYTKIINLSRFSRIVK